MGHVLRWLWSLIFVIVIYLWMAVLGILFTPYALVSKRGALRACKIYARTVIWLARVMLGLRGEVRGPVPTGEVMIAAKHQSFFDIILIFDAVPHAKFIMKRELLWTPFIGLYAKRLGCIPVDRGKRGKAVARMVRDVAAEFSEPGQLVIYPQGTRVAPGATKPYKVGTAILYQGLGYPCVPAATNVGLFWPRKGILRKPGLGVVEFLDPIVPGVARDEFMERIERDIEARSNALMLEAKGKVDAAD
ncbi:1-acyl-sn-glycerol-3-phosphate acyltransferase [Cribrihabitans marinus]|uniref:1-acyl-sn-glycerol-3-phosphate acyltransferase n=1 Tax=Cribrihabitans marinus TaxID=1227549 RepID=A0A1H7CG32_9RHOB|nr:1-acyl-sn-glycerol-3-phosphate acyltransferase [Cribrihabitans marinus]GGH35365.1 1-acyl-sn-glycerol-3-phosphate acyltransferase [Cribrihabitans marinus]SEJ88436.1 1-acyl-sn-glycerol-3-phosphate acyltransferase [Cribrihabitans marinus]